jgi:hypothetical protein
LLRVDELKFADRRQVWALLAVKPGRPDLQFPDHSLAISDVPDDVQGYSCLQTIGGHLLCTDLSASGRDNLATVETRTGRSVVDCELDRGAATTADAVDGGGSRLRSKLRRVDRPFKEKVEQFTLMQR